MIQSLAESNRDCCFFLVGKVVKEMATRERGQSTGLSLVRPYNCLGCNDSKIIILRHGNIFPMYRPFREKQNSSRIGILKSFAVMIILCATAANASPTYTSFVNNDQGKWRVAILSTAYRTGSENWTTNCFDILLL